MQICSVLLYTSFLRLIPLYSLLYPRSTIDSEHSPFWLLLPHICWLQHSDKSVARIRIEVNN